MGFLDRLLGRKRRSECGAQARTSFQKRVAR
jgi:hypothetical protein